MKKSYQPTTVERRLGGPRVLRMAGDDVHARHQSAASPE
jgi:hypothetical protein